MILAVLALLMSSYIADSVASIGRIRSGVKAGSLQLAGKTHEEAQKLLIDRAELLVSEPVELFADTHRVSVAPSEIAFSPDPQVTADNALGVGRRGNFIVRLWHRIRALFATTDVGWASTYDREAASLLVKDWAERIDTEGHEAGIDARGDTIVPVGAIPGRKLDRGGAIETMVDGLETWPRRSMELPIAVQPRRTDVDDARQAAEVANRWTRAPIDLIVPDGTRRRLSREQLASMIEAVPKRRAGRWELSVRFSPERVSDELTEQMASYELEAKDATFAVEGTAVSVVPGQNGRLFDTKGTAKELGDAADRDEPRKADAAFKSVKPDLSTDEARALNITELVSSNTTNHPCCAARVDNIHRIADTVNGAIVRPGESFSLNDYVGERTEDKGYVLAPMIFDGEFKDAIGGGVSQFATTMFSAIFYSGNRFDAYRPHSYYISRYTAGREATVSWPHPDLKFTNTSGAGVLIRTHYTSNSITVNFYGDKEGREVRAESGPRTNPTDFETQYKENPALKPGEQHVAQQGAPGFDIVVYRVIKENGKESREKFFTRYRPQPKIVEVAPGDAPCPTPAAGETPCPTEAPTSPTPRPRQEAPTPTPQPQPSPSP